MNSIANLAHETTHQQQRYLDPGKCYHFFISYRDIEDDNLWVRNLITALQNYGFICLDHRADFVGGQNIFRNINEAVRISTKTLVILSKHYTDSDFCQYELGCILQMSMASKENLIIPVLREKCNIPECLKLVTYIDATGTDNKWILQIIKAFEQKVVERTYYQQLNPVRHYKNLDKVHMEVTTISCFKRMAFDLKRYLPESLNDPSIHITLKTFHGILDTLSNSNFIKWGRLCILQSIGKCCAFVLMIFWMVLYGLFLILLIFHKSARFKNDWTEVILGVIIVLLYPFCSICLPYMYIVQRSGENDKNGCVTGISIMDYTTVIKMAFCAIDEFTTVMAISVTSLSEINISKYGMFLFVVLSFVYATAIFPWFFFWYRKQNYIEDYLAEEERKRKDESTVVDLEYYTTEGGKIATDIAMLKLLIKDEANQWILEIASDYITDFMEEKLENSASPRHTKRAICLCEYVERCWNKNIK